MISTVVVMLLFFSYVLFKPRSTGTQKELRGYVVGAQGVLGTISASSKRILELRGRNPVVRPWTGLESTFRFSWKHFVRKYDLCFLDKIVYLLQS